MGYDHMCFNKRQRVKVAKLFLDRKPVMINPEWKDIFAKLEIEEDEEDPENTEEGDKREVLEAAQYFGGSKSVQSCLRIPFRTESKSERAIHFVLDMGCSFNILKPEAYEKIKDFEVRREPVKPVQFTNIQGVNSLRKGFVSHITLQLGKTKHIIPFFIFVNCSEFSKSFIF